MKGLRDLSYEDTVKELKLQTLTHLNCSSSPEDQDYEGHHLDFFNKPGESEEEVTILHAELLSTGTVYHLQYNRNRINLLSIDK